MYNNWATIRLPMDQALELERTFTRQERQQQQRQQWRQRFTWLYTRLQTILTPLYQAPTAPIIVYPGDAYFLAAGTYRLRVLTGQLWIPEAGIFGAGDRIDLQPNGQGLSLCPADAHPTVFTVHPRLTAQPN